VIRLLRFAEKDIQESFYWYENKKKTPGISFIDELEATFQRIQENPHLSIKVDENIYRALCKNSLSRFII